MLASHVQQNLNEWIHFGKFVLFVSCRYEAGNTAPVLRLSLSQSKMPRKIVDAALSRPRPVSITGWNTQNVTSTMKWVVISQMVIFMFLCSESQFYAIYNGENHFQIRTGGWATMFLNMVVRHSALLGKLDWNVKDFYVKTIGWG